MKTLISMAAAAAIAVTITGCNTMAGVGRDVSATGQGVTNASLKVRNDWREWRHRHDASYETERAACSGGSEADREICRDKIRADYRRKMADARAQYKRAEMRAENDRDREWDSYERARDTCYELKGAEEERCISDVRGKRPQ